MDIDGISIRFECPQCSFENEATFQDARLGRRIICRGCKADIQLADHENSVGQARKTIPAEINSLFRYFDLKLKL